MSIRFAQQNLSSTCGVGLVFNFNRYIPWDGINRPSWHVEPRPSEFLENAVMPGGAGWVCAGFTRYPPCKEAYETLAKRYNIVFQSPVRMNNNSGNRFFWCVYDTKAADPRGPRPRWVGKSKGAQKPAALVAWEVMEKPAVTIDNSKHKWPFK